MLGRLRWVPNDEGAERIRQSMQPHADRDFNFIDYGEDMETAAVNRDTAKTLADVLRVLHAEQQNLSFAQNDMEAIMAQVFDAAAWNTPASKDSIPEKNHWCQGLAKRARCLCRHVAQALKRPKPTAWVMKLGLAGSQPKADESLAAKKVSAKKSGKHGTMKEKADEEDKIFTWDAEMQVVNVLGPGQKLQKTVPMRLLFTKEAEEHPKKVYLNFEGQEKIVSGLSGD
eukprot:11176066-Lingulodinium_polyedra.AAC.1